jgi:hypothetical protein
MAARIVAVLAYADPADQRAIYDVLGVNLTYHPYGRVHVGAGSRVLGVRVGGPIRSVTTPILRGVLSVVS